MQRGANTPEDLFLQEDFMSDRTEVYYLPIHINAVWFIFLVVGWLFVMNASLLSLHSKQEHTKQTFC